MAGVGVGMKPGRFAKRNAGVIVRRAVRLQDAHIITWLWSEERAARAGYIAVLGGRVVNAVPASIEHKEELPV